MDWSYFPPLVTDGTRVLVSGDTYFLKDKLQAAGFKWDKLNRAWVLSITEFAKGKNIDDLVQLLRVSTKDWVTLCRNKGITVKLEQNGILREVDISFRGTSSNPGF